MNEPERPADTKLERLDDTDLGFVDENLDIRDLKVIDRDGADIGHVSNLFIDTVQRRVRMIEVRAGGFLGLGERHFLLPADTISSVTQEDVHVNQTRDRIVGSPVYDPALVVGGAGHYAPYYGYYGFSPFWGDETMYPGLLPFMQEPPSAAAAAQASNDAPAAAQASNDAAPGWRAPVSRK